MHHVDETHERVYVHGGGWAASMTAKAAAKQLWPGYEIILASQELVEDLNGEDL